MDSRVLFKLETVYVFVCNYNSIILIWAAMGTFLAKRSNYLSNLHCSSPFTNTSGSGIRSINHENLLSTLELCWMDILASFTLSAIWVFIVALGFSISNQRQPVSIQEDKLNKPWRPLPSKRITPSQASTFLLITTIIGSLLSSVLGSLGPYLIQLAASYQYNDLGGAQSHHILRDALNAIGMTSWLLGCIDVAGGPGFRLFSTELSTTIMFVSAVTATISIQDFRDVDGDRACGRTTLPIVIGAGAARVILAMSILMWSYGITIGYNLSLLSWLTGFGTLIAIRLLLFRTCSADKTTLELWYGWFAALCLALL